MKLPKNLWLLSRKLTIVRHFDFGAQMYLTMLAGVNVIKLP